MMAGILYGLCTLTALLCTWLLLRAYFRSRYKLLLWGGLCFGGLTLNNALVGFDLMVLGSQVSLAMVRLIVALLSVLILLYGLIWDAE